MILRNVAVSSFLFWGAASADEVWSPWSKKGDSNAHPTTATFHEAGEKTSSVLQSNLRSSSTDPAAALVDTMPLLAKPLGDLTGEEGVELVDALHGSLQSAVADLHALDTSLVPVFEQVGGLEQVSNAVALVSDLTGFLRSVFLNETEVEDSEGTEIAVKRANRRMKRQEDRGGDNKQDGNHKDYYKKFQQAPNQQNNPGQKTALELQRAILSGDMKMAHASVRHHTSGYNHYGQKTGARGRRLSRAEMCFDLAECAATMSYYDLFAFFYSDDIDPVTGEVDDSVIKNDEATLLEKYNRIQDLANGITSDPNTDEDCNILLQEFHRTIEVNGVAQWQGATVSQVCLAEGTTVYIRLEDIAATFLDADSVTTTDVIQIEQQLEPQVAVLSNDIAAETFRCAEELFLTLAPDAEEPFVFGGCGSLNTVANCAMENYQFPISLGDPTQYVMLPGPNNHCFQNPYTYFDSASECQAAGNSIREGLGYPPGGITTGSWTHTPCRCFIRLDGLAVHFNGRTNYCHSPGIDNRYRAVCKNQHYDAGAEATRDSHGKLIDNTKLPFTFKTYAELEVDFDACWFALPAAEKNSTGFVECSAEKIYKPIGKSLELVFGERPSPGFICGIKDAVVSGGKALPGSCCLDSPYELGGDLWGHQYDCSTDCLNPGPLLAGIKEEACAAQGGTFCPSDPDCSDLKNCVQSMSEDASSSSAFRGYLEGSPTIEHPTNFDECGAARRYFGFDESFINDAVICVEVNELRSSRNFDFLNTFFGVGSSTPPSAENFLTPPDRAKSTAVPVTKADKWAKVLFSISTALSILTFINDLCEETPVPCVTFCPVFNPAEIIKGILNTLLSIVVFVVETLSSISEFVFSQQSGDADAIAAQEDATVIFGNMERIVEKLFEIESNTAGTRRLLTIDSDGPTTAVAKEEDSTLAAIKEEMAEMKEQMKEQNDKIEAMLKALLETKD